MRAVTVRRSLVLPLHGSGFHAVVVFCREFTRGWASAESARTAIVANTIHRVVVHHGTVVNVGDIRHIDAGYGPVIEELSAPPFAPLKAPSVVTKAIIDAAVEANVRAPVTRMPEERASTPAPIAWRPEHARLRRHHPRARNPVVSVVGIVSPVTRRPHEARAWTHRLLIHRQRRRTNPN